MAEENETDQDVEFISEEEFSKSPETYILRGCREHPVAVRNAAGNVTQVFGSRKRTPEEIEADHKEYQLELQAWKDELTNDNNDEFDGSYFL